MTETSRNQPPGSTLAQAYRTIKKLRTEIDNLKQKAREPVAVIGLGCRFPGAPDPDAYWDMLKEGRDAVSKIPKERWDAKRYYHPSPQTPGKIYLRHGAFLDQETIESFDADFFGIAPREAQSLGPAQRLILEVAWEALENAGIPAPGLRGSRTGVFIGAGYEYGQEHIHHLRSDPYFATGTDASLTAGRLAYALGLQGPVFVVSTTCSSSMVALHQACLSLRSEESRMAIVGGVHLHTTVDGVICGCLQGMYSPSGRSKTFDASADGYGIGEGCGVVVLKRLSDALADKDRIMAVIRGSAVNHDGPSSGLTVPNGEAQVRMLKTALQDANLEPDAVAYVETHGTGTSLGDPIEANALGKVFSTRSTPLFIGSVKTNIGHLDTAAGMAGLIKVVLAMLHGEIPPSLHFITPNPHIPWDDLPLKVVTEPTPWPPGHKIAGVSSFGFSGTNAHAIVEAPLPRNDSETESMKHHSPSHELLVMSAREPQALRDAAAAWARHFTAHPDIPLADACYTAAAGRTSFSHRLSLVATSLSQAAEQLNLFARGERSLIIDGTVPGKMKLQVPTLEHGNDHKNAAERQRHTAWGFNPRPGNPRLENIGTMYVSGEAVNWEDVFQGRNLQKIALPTYPFQRRPYRLPPAPQPATPRGLWDTIIDNMIHSAALKTTICETRLSLEAFPWMTDHRAFGEMVMPASGMLAYALHKARLRRNAPISWFENVVFPTPLILPDQQAKTLQMTWQEGGDKSFTLTSLSKDAPEPILHAEGILRTISREDKNEDIPSPQELEKARKRILQPIPLETLRDIDPNFFYGPAFSWLREIWRGDSEALARAVQPDEENPPPLGGEGDEWVLHPGLLDACFQLTGATLDNGTGARSLLPFAIEKLAVMEPGGDAREWWIHARQTGEDKWDIDLFHKNGDLLAIARGFRTRPAAAPVAATDLEFHSWLHSLKWQVRPHRPAPSSGKDKTETFLIVHPSHPVNFINLVHQRNHRCLHTTPDEIKAAIARCVQKGIQLDHAVFFTMPAPSDDLPAAAYAGYAGALGLIQALIRADLRPRVWLITQGAHKAEPGDLVRAEGAPLWGLGRSISHEYPDIFCACIDLPHTSDNPEKTDEQLITEMLNPGGETALAFRGNRRLSPSLARFWPDPASEESPVRVEISESRTLDALEIVSMQRQPPGPGEIEIKVAAAGLNFRDVLQALGMMDTDGLDEGVQAERGLGFECAGRVVAVGDGVLEFQTGDRVMALSSRQGCLASFIIASVEETIPIPAGLSFVEAATIPVAFATAYYGLHTLAGVQAGECVFIHAAAGGVGQAAVQLATAAKAHILTTASLSKQETLKEQGIEFVFDSRNPQGLADQVMAATNGRGPNIVLNSLSGDFIKESFKAAAKNGRFIEIGKLGILTNQEAQALRPDVRYETFQLGQDTQVPVKTLLKKIGELFEQGVLRPLPHRTFPVQQVQDAFRYMQQAKHIGKVVIIFDPLHKKTIQDNATYLVTGGLGGLGLTVAQTLVDAGARHLVLNSRSGIVTNSDAQEIADMEHKGATVKIVKGDVSDLEDARRMIKAGSDPFPLKGIVHAAGVLDDGALMQQTPDRYATVAAPKVYGAWNLHKLTRKADLDFFVMFSSTASLTGGPGQANYAAANAFLDSLAHQRNQEGLPGLSIDWGAWSGKGMAARTRNRTWLEKEGELIISPEQGARIFRLLLGIQGQMGVMRPEPAAKDFRQRKHHSGPVEEMRRAQGPVRRKILESIMQDHIGRALGWEEPVPLDQGFFDLGMDSLMAVELRNQLQRTFSCRLPGTFALDYPTGRAMAAYMMENVFSDLFGEAVSGEDETSEAEDGDVDDIVRQLSDELGIKDI